MIVRSVSNNVRLRASSVSANLRWKPPPIARRAVHDCAPLQVLLVHPVAAGPLDDALSAFRRQDYETALRLWRPLAEHGDVRAQGMLGVMYFEGLGVPKDYAQAAKWHRLAADQGNAVAQTNLGSLYINGEGVPRDYVLGYMWSNLGASGGYDLGARNRELVATRMTPAAIEEAQRLSREWKPK